MTGPEHYMEAERCLGFASQDEGGSSMERYHLDAAQAHATLALAAATALPQQRMMALAEYKAWAGVAAEKAEDTE
ncbi:hypothetical protein [Streptomyces sp. enrichment culture]|uniref:hypothetical protein n=1 Tax=Streptomyces sp. enrichment culture TaxID=1795815 RepID=UPI003F54D433